MTLTVLGFLVSSSPPVAAADAPAESDDEVAEETSVRAGLGPLILSAEIESHAGLLRLPYDRLSLPVGAHLQMDAYTPRRQIGVTALLELGVDPLGPEGAAAVRSLEFYRRGLFDRLDLRVGRLNLVRGGRFRFVDGVDARLRIVDHLHVAAWGGAAWHPEWAAIVAAGPLWGAELAYRSPNPIGGSFRYDHLTGEGGLPVDRLGGDVSLHLPRAAGLVAEARIDVVPAYHVVELLAVAGEIRPHHRVHLRFEGGLTNPRVDVLPYGGSIYSTLVSGPTVYVDGRLRLALAPGVLTVDVGGLGIAGEDQVPQPGVRSTLGISSHPGRKWRHAIRVSAIHGPGGTATFGLAEVGRNLGPLGISILAEQAFFQFTGRPWRAATHLGAQLALDPVRALHVTLTGQLDLGRTPVPDGRLLLVVTVRMYRGKVRGPDPVRDRYLSPWSPYRWERDRVPHSPGTVPGADPYPSVPQGEEPRDAE